MRNLPPLLPQPLPLLLQKRLRPLRLHPHLGRPFRKKMIRTVRS